MDNCGVSRQSVGGITEEPVGQNLQHGSDLEERNASQGRSVADIDKLNEDLARMSSIIAASPGGVFQLEARPPHKLVYANDVFFSTRGYSRRQVEEELADHAESFIYPEDLPGLLEFLWNLSLRKGSQGTHTHRVVRRDGAIRWVLTGAGIDDELLSCIEYDITVQKEVEQQLKISEERFRIALTQSKTGIWEYDIASQRVTQTKLSQDMNGLPMEIETVPHGLVQSKYVHPDTAAVFTELYRRIQAGDKNADATYKVRSLSGEYRWEKAVYTNIFDKSGRPVRAIGLLEDISAQSEITRNYQLEVKSRAAVTPDLFVSYQVNLTTGKVQNYRAATDRQQEVSRANTYERLLRDGSERAAGRDDKLRLLAALDYHALLQNYKDGKTMTSVEHRRTNAAGKISWVCITVNVMREPDTGDMVAFLYVRDVDERKKLELRLSERVERDKATGFYSRETMESMIDALIGVNAKGDERCALILIDLDNFKALNSALGDHYGVQVLADIAQVIKNCFQPQTIIGRIGSAEFIVFMQQYPSEKWLLKKLKQLRDVLNFSYGKEENHVHISGSLGVATAMAQEAEYDLLFQQVGLAMNDVKQTGKNGFQIFDPNTTGQNEAEPLTERERFGVEYFLDQMDMPMVILAKTHEIFYMNRCCRTLLSVGNNTYKGEKCYQIFRRESASCANCFMQALGRTQFHCQMMFFKHVNKEYLIKAKEVIWGGVKAYLIVAEPVDANGNQKEVSGEGDMQSVLLKSMGALQMKKNISDAIFSVLENIGLYYQAKRANYIEHDKVKGVFRVLYEWCAPHVESQKSGLDKLSSPEVLEWMKQVSTYSASFDVDAQTAGYFNVVDPGAAGDANLLSALLPFVGSEIAKQRLQKRMEYLGYHDDLTGLLNRNSYLKYREDIREESLSALGVISVDINGLRGINRQFGYEYGDEMVKKVALVLSQCFANDFVCRFAGDEFLIFCQDVAYDRFVQKIHDAQEQTEAISPSIVTFGYGWEKVNIALNALMIRADEMMRIEKQKYYIDSQEISKYHQPLLRDNLLKGLAQGEYVVYLQPKADVNTGQIVGAEALTRHIHPIQGIIPPAKFIPLLEETKLIHHLDLFVFESVCKILAKWAAAGIKMIPVSLNFSRATMLKEDLMQNMQVIQSRYGVAQEYLEIEITESLGEMNQEMLAGISNKLRNAKYRIALDDFGSQYSSLSILAAMQFDVLKLDKSLVDDIVTNASSQVIARSSVRICQELEIESVAEGVETIEQWQVLKKIGCCQAQGYFFNKPLPVQVFESKYIGLLT